MRRAQISWAILPLKRKVLRGEIEVIGEREALSLVETTKILKNRYIFI